MNEFFFFQRCNLLAIFYTFNPIRELNIKFNTLDGSTFSEYFQRKYISPTLFTLLRYLLYLIEQRNRMNRRTRESLLEMHFPGSCPPFLCAQSFDAVYSKDLYRSSCPYVNFTRSCLPPTFSHMPFPASTRT